MLTNMHASIEPMGYEKKKTNLLAQPILLSNRQLISRFAELSSIRFTYYWKTNK